MARTIQQYYRDREEEELFRKHNKNSKGPRHARNIPGQGMKVINRWPEDEEFDDLETVDDEHNVIRQYIQR